MFMVLLCLYEKLDIQYGYNERIHVYSIITKKRQLSETIRSVYNALQSIGQTFKIANCI